MSTRVAKLALGVSEMELSDDATAVRLISDATLNSESVTAYADAAKNFATGTDDGLVAGNVVMTHTAMGRYISVDTGDATEAYLIIEES
jgi:hypothetical protein